MGRGLSKQQKAILAVLEQKRDAGEFVVTGVIIHALGLKRDPKVYSAVSRGISRLCARGLVEVYQPSIHRQGKGFGYGLPSQDPR